jgi:hypothetical protein
MKRHLIATLLMAAALGTSILIGHHLGARRGEAAVADTLRARAADQAATPVVPPPPGTAASSADIQRPRTRADMKRLLDDLQGRLTATGAPVGPFSAAFKNPEILEALNGLSLDEVRLALELVSEMPFGLERSGLSVALLARWAREAPAGALAHFRTHRDDAGPFGTLWLTAVVMPWSEKDPAAAAQALAATLSSEDDDILQGSIGNTVWMVAEKLSAVDPAAAMRHVAELPEWARDSAFSAVAKQVHGDGRQAFLDRIRALPEGPEKTAWQQAAATAMAPVDATAASQWIDSLGLPEAQAHGSTRAVFEKWKQYDPKAATEWAAARLPEKERAGLVTKAVESWAAREPNDCGRWLSSLESGPQLDGAVAAFARAIAAKDPDSARAWAERLTDPQLREESLAQVARLSKVESQ